jgi:hypothetical protein
MEQPRAIPQALRAKMEDPDHPLTQIISRLLTDQQPIDPADETLRAKILRAVKRSKTIEHYDAVYALWDTPGMLQTPMRAFVRLVSNMISEL